MKKACLISFILCMVSWAAAGTWTIIDAPGASDTRVYGISGNNIVAQANGQSFLYDGTTWTTLAMPGATSTRVYGIDADNIVGSYHDASGDHGFLYDGTTWTTLDVPGASSTIAYDIDGGKIVGQADRIGNHQGFLYDGTTWTTIAAPYSTMTTVPYGIDGDNIVGSVDNVLNFAYDGTTWTDWTELMISEILHTKVRGIDGDNIVGYCYGQHGWGYGSIGLSGDGPYGFLFDGTTWTTFAYDAPGAWSLPTRAYDIDGDKIVGCVVDGNQIHGFIYTIPEPATLALLALGGIFIRRRK